VAELKQICEAPSSFKLEGGRLAEAMLKMTGRQALLSSLVSTIARTPKPKGEKEVPS
jgi:hypothetical protein